MSQQSDPVNHPAHYQGRSGIEAGDVIDDFGLGYWLGNAVKYLLRAGRKGDALEDLKKAHWCLGHEIQRREDEALASYTRQPRHRPKPQAQRERIAPFPAEGW